VTLETLEELLPALDKLGVLELVGNNQQLLLNAGGFLLVEGAPFLLGPLAGAISVGPPAFFVAAGAAFAAEAALVTNHVMFLNLDAGFFAGLLLIPLGGLFGALGVALGSVKK